MNLTARSVQVLHQLSGVLLPGVTALMSTVFLLELWLLPWEEAQDLHALALTQVS